MCVCAELFRLFRLSSEGKETKEKGPRFGDLFSIASRCYKTIDGGAYEHGVQIAARDIAAVCERTLKV